MNRVDTICPWCFEVQDTGLVPITGWPNEYREQDPESLNWREIESSGHETCKNCNQEFYWRFRTIIVAEVSKLEWSIPKTASEMTPSVVALEPISIKGGKDANS